MHIKKNTKQHAKDDLANMNSIDTSNDVAGQHFHLYFGFVRGFSYSISKENQPTITNIDGYNSYLIIVNRITRYVWIFLTSSKDPSITISQRS